MDATNSNAVTEAKSTSLTAWFGNNPDLAKRGIDESLWNALTNSVYPGAKRDSILMAVDYCHARNLDVLLKPVHLVPMSVKDAQTGGYSWRDVPMPGIGLYRIQAERTKNYAGADAPMFGPEITKQLLNKAGSLVEFSFPEWCQYTLHKQMPNGQIVPYSALEYWVENYAVEGKGSEYPNAMWKKRPRAQLAKCAEAQALRKAWPEVGQEPTAEEMEGKEFIEAKDVTPAHNNSKGIAKNLAEESINKKIHTGRNITAEQANQLIHLASQAGLSEGELAQRIKVNSVYDLDENRFKGGLDYLTSLIPANQPEIRV